jgi:hypothetical protein
VSPAVKRVTFVRTIAVVLVGITGARTVAGAPNAASRPVTQPATTQAVHAGPARAVIIHAMAMAAGDAVTVRNCYLAQTPQEAAVADAYAGMAGAIRKLQIATKDKWGDGGFAVIGFGPMFDEEIKRLQHAQYSVEGNRAIVFANGRDRSPMVLLMTDGVWKISVAQTFTRNMDRRTARIAAQTRAYQELADEIAAGKFRASVEAKIAGSEKVAKAMKEVDEKFPPVSGTTQPSR